MDFYARAFWVVVMSSLVGCGGGGGSSSSGGVVPPTYTVGGTISGLSGTVVLQNNGSGNKSVGVNGSFSFSASLIDGAAYSASVLSNPAGQTCTIANAVGVISGANISNVSVTCVTGKPGAPVVTLTAVKPKELKFSWSSVAGATYYRISKDPDGSSGYAQVGSDVLGISATDLISVHAHNWINARYKVEACNSAGCTASASISTAAEMINAIGYFKASDNTWSIGFGHAMAISSDGTTLAVGALDHSSSTGINNYQANNSAHGSGAVYVFFWDGLAWQQQAYVKASNPDSQDQFGGQSITLSADGNTMVVGAALEDSGTSGINGIQSDNFAEDSGAAYVFTRSAGVWTQQAYMKASNTDAGDLFGYQVALAADGNTLAISAMREASSATGVGGNQADDSAATSGATYVFSRSGSTWSQQAYLKASNASADEEFGNALSISSDGNTLAVGAHREDSAATGVGGDQLDNSAVISGAAYVFSRSGSSWTQQAYIKASNTAAFDAFGCSLSLSGDGNTLAVGAIYEASGDAGVGADQADNSLFQSGAVYMYSRTATVWSQQAYIKASNVGYEDQFGFAVSLSSTGSMLAVSAFHEDGAAAGVNGDQSGDAVELSGAVYTFARTGSAWSQSAYVKASNPDRVDLFGFSLALSGDGGVLAVGARDEDSLATGINGSQGNDNPSGSGAVYLY